MTKLSILLAGTLLALPAHAQTADAPPAALGSGTLLAQTGQTQTGQSQTGQSQTGQSQTGQGQTGQSQTGQGQTGQTRAGQSQTGQTGQAQGGDQAQSGGCAELRRQAGVTIDDDKIATRDKVVGELEKAGVKNVTVLNTAYLVEATSPDDTCVRMIIDTAGMQQARSGQGQASGSGQGQSGQGRQAQGSAGQGQTGQGQTGQSASGEAGQGGDQDPMRASRAEVGEVLSEAGYSDVRFLEAAYAVAGEMPNGDTVMLMMSSDATGQIRQREMQEGGVPGEPGSTGTQSGAKPEPGSQGSGQGSGTSN